MASSKVAISRDLLPVLPAWGKATLLALAIGSVAWFAFFAKALLLTYPPVWPDEALFANPAVNLVHHGTMSTDVWVGALPGTEQHTYWMPPLYFLYIASIFRFTGPGIVPLRFASTAAAFGVLVLTYVLTIRSGLGRWLSLLPISLLALDAVFLRGALVGRPDMLAVAIILFSLWLATKPLAPWNSFATGIVCALAALTHPIGAAAPIAVVAWHLLSRERRAPRFLLPLLAGILIAFLPWLAYIALDPQSFVAQFGSQLVRKKSLHRTVQDFRAAPFFQPIGQYAFQGGRLRDVVWVLALWLFGLVGLGDALRSKHDHDSPARHCLLLLFLCQAVILAVVLWAGEMFYTIYIIPITAIGLCHLLKNGPLAGSAGWRRTILGSVALLCIGGFVLSNLQHTLRINRVEGDYTGWSNQISARIPPGSTVLLSVIPDPYFVLMARPDLNLREFVPEKFPIDHDIIWDYMSQADYVIVGAGFQSPSARVEGFLRAKGTLIDMVRSKGDNGYFARIYRVTQPRFSP